MHYQSLHGSYDPAYIVAVVSPVYTLSFNLPHLAHLPLNTNTNLHLMDS